MNLKNVYIDLFENMQLHNGIKTNMTPEDMEEYEKLVAELKGEKKDETETPSGQSTT